MNTAHKVYFDNSSDMKGLDDESIDLLVTSPPYPMIEMWDSLFSSLNEDIEENLRKGNGNKAFELMHRELNKVWSEVSRVLKKGGIACINIGDATRKVDGSFQLFPNHVKITKFFQENGFTVLPDILWRKQTNKANKFMGSGMLPSNAYVTLEHEYILIFRKGEGTRNFEPKSERRYNSAYFWEERNKWFSDVWTGVKGTLQKLDNGDLRDRAAAFPLELPYRLINMYSVYGDTVLDPFWGTGTTTLASMISCRNSVGYELEKEFMSVFKDKIKRIREIANSVNSTRLSEHRKFVEMEEEKGNSLKYEASNYDFGVRTKQEKDILLRTVKNVREINENHLEVVHKKFE